MKKLNLGCGNDIKNGYINLDIIDKPKVDVIHDLNIFPYPFKDNYFNEIYSSHSLQYSNNLFKVMEELYRITKKGGILKIKVPYWNHAQSFAEPNIIERFTYNKFDYFNMFKVKKRILIPTKIGMFIPTQKIKLVFSLIFGHIVRDIYYEIEEK